MTPPTHDATIDRVDGGDAPVAASAPGLAAVIRALGDRFGDRLTTATAARALHGGGEGLSASFPPDAVVFTITTDEVTFVVRQCHDARIPVIAFGTGTSLEGHVQALHGGVTINLSRMDSIIEVNQDDLDCRVEAGVTREQLNLFLRDQGLFFPLDSGANASLGGMAATRASGTNAVRYGTMRDVTLGLTVVTADGRIIRTGGRARKSSAGLDLTRLYVGSEGTLGIITEVQLRLFAIPETTIAAVCGFDTLEGAVDTAIQTLQCGIQVARIELLDALQMKACIAYDKLEGVAAVPTLFGEFHGSAATTAEQARLVAEIATGCGGTGLVWSTLPEERSRLWKARHNAYYAAKALSPGKEVFSTDACVPISRLAECIAATRVEADASGLSCPIVGHVGDGNFHLLVPFDPGDAAEVAAAERLAASISRRAIALGGTCTGEHGVGVHKIDALREEHGDAVDVMRTIKVALDPRNIMNPGKMFAFAAPD